MTSKKPLSVAYMRRTVTIAWSLLVRYCDAVGGPVHRWLREADETATKQESAHRAMGKRFTGGRRSYRLSVGAAARCVIIHHVYCGAWVNSEEAAPPASWSDVASIRHDCALAYAIREHLTPAQLETLKAAAAIDYAEDIAS